MDPLILLLDSDGIPIIVDDDGGIQYNSLLERYSLGDGGEFTLVVSHAGGGSVGEIIVEVTTVIAVGDV